MTVMGRVGGKGNPNSAASVSSALGIFNYDFPLPFSFTGTSSVGGTGSPNNTVAGFRRLISNQTNPDSNQCGSGAGESMVKRVLICCAILLGAGLVRELVLRLAICYNPNLGSINLLHFPSVEGFEIHFQLSCVFEAILI